MDTVPGLGPVDAGSRLTGNIPMRRARMMLALVLPLMSAPVGADDGKRYLIIHADDAGMCHSANRAHDPGDGGGGRLVMQRDGAVPADQGVRRVSPGQSSSATEKPFDARCRTSTPARVTHFARQPEGQCAV
jgi:hypothetical protein